MGWFSPRKEESKESNAFLRQREILELWKLWREVEDSAKRPSILRANLTKTELEIEELKRRARAEPHWVWQRLQVVAIIVGVSLSYLTYRRSVEESRQRGLQTAVEHLQNGWPSGALEVAAYGSDGVTILVKSVDSTGGTGQKAWPIPTRAALEEIYSNRQLLSTRQKSTLHAAMGANATKLAEVVYTIHRDSENVMGAAALGTTVVTAVDDRIETVVQLACIQLSLQQLLGVTPENWANTSKDVLSILGGKPGC